MLYQMTVIHFTWSDAMKIELTLSQALTLQNAIIAHSQELEENIKMWQEYGSMMMYRQHQKNLSRMLRVIQPFIRKELGK